MAMGVGGFADFRARDFGFARCARDLRFAVFVPGMRFLGGSVAIAVRCNRLAHLAGFCERGLLLLQRIYRGGALRKAVGIRRPGQYTPADLRGCDSIAKRRFFRFSFVFSEKTKDHSLSD